MSDPLNTPEITTLEVYSDPLSLAKGRSMYLRMAETALAVDIPLLRVLVNLSVPLGMDTRWEARGEREEAGNPRDPT
jgi:hypothetical protein